jgi:rSAM/selenodomain-associated transferase 1
MNVEGNHKQSAKPTCPAIIVMLKAPRAGTVKTRLTTLLSQESAATLAACFVQDTIAKAKSVAAHVIVAYAPADSRREIETLLPDNLHWIEQRGQDLGARLEAVTAEAAANFAPFVVLGTDSPTLPAAFISEALRALAANECDVALGPADDGGYYLIGLRQFVPDLFQNIEWSTSLAYEQTARNATLLNQRILRLPVWYDVDTPLDLLRLRAELNADREAQTRAPATHCWMRAHDSLLESFTAPDCLDSAARTGA